MKHRFVGLVMIGLFGLALMSPAPALERDNEVANWDFDVYLDDKKVGKHYFTVSEAGGMRRVQSEANFDVRFLFISAYQYEHSAAERWTGDCLVELAASTNANGKRFQVSGEQTSAGFLVEKGDSPVRLPECVMTFAYWNPDFLDQPRLLNPQTGEYVDVNVEEVGSELLEVRGQPVAATRFRLTAREVDVTLWYSSDDEWLALESVAKGGRVIRYELS
jgi:hypothetical protein